MSAPDWTPERIAQVVAEWPAESVRAMGAALSTATERIAYLTRENGRLREREAAWVAKSSELLDLYRRWCAAEGHTPYALDEAADELQALIRIYSASGEETK